MKRNKKALQNKKLIQLRLEENKYLNTDTYIKIQQSHVYYIKSVSKKFCPAPIYKDLKDLIDIIKTYKAEPSNWVIDYRNRSYIDSNYRFNRYQDPMLKELSNKEYNLLETRLKQFLIPVSFWTSFKHDKIIIPVKSYTWKLNKRYKNYLFVEKVNVDSYYYEHTHNHNSQYTRLESKINKCHLRPKMTKAKSKRYKYKDDWWLYKKDYLEKFYKKEMMQDISDYYNKDIL